MTTAKPLLEVSPEGKLSVNFHAGQLRAWDSAKRIVAIIAGGRSGKTSFAPLWLHREMQTKGPGDYLVAAPNYPLIDKAAGPEIEHFFGRLLRLGELKRSPTMQFAFSAAGAKRLWGKTPDRPPRILFGHAEDPESLEAMTAKAAWLDEAGQGKFRLGSWEAVQQRLSVDQGRCLISSKPYNLGWLKQKVYDPWQASGRNHPEIDVVGFDSTANPSFPREELERARRSLPAWRFQMQYLGLFTRPSGLIYESFDATKNTARRFVLPDSWPRYIGVDFGAVNTAAVHLAGEQTPHGAPTGRFFAYRAYHPARRQEARLTPKEHVATLLSGERGVPDAFGGAGSEDAWREEFGAAGLYVREPDVKDVEVGIDRVHSAFRDGKLILFDDLTDLIEEVQTYSRELNEAGEPTEKIENKADFHLLDSLRYVGIGVFNADGEGWDATPDPAARLEVVRAPAGVFNPSPRDSSDSRDRPDDDDAFGSGGVLDGPLYPDAW